MCDRAAVAHLLPIWESFSIQGQRFLIIADLPRDMGHRGLLPGDTELISHVPVEIQHMVCMFSSLREIATIKCQPGQNAFGSYRCLRVNGSLRQGEAFFQIGLQLFCSLWSMNLQRCIGERLQNPCELVVVAEFPAESFAFV